MEGHELTGGLTYKDRCGTIIDWNLCFNADGASSDRAFRSGTPAFMAPVLLNDQQISRRTLGHDMESFFAVMVWIASLNYASETDFQAKPLVSLTLDRKKTPKDIVSIKDSWFKILDNFGRQIINHFEPAYSDDARFVRCLLKLRKILYSPPNLNDDDVVNLYTGSRLHKNNNKETEDADPKEGLFQMCMKVMDEYLKDTKGFDAMEEIDSQARTRHTPESLMQEGNRVD
jgi:Fungal protein kinase